MVGSVRDTEGGLAVTVRLEPQRRLSDRELAAAIARVRPVQPYQACDPYRPLPARALRVDFYEPTFVAGRRRAERAA